MTDPRYAAAGRLAGKVVVITGGGSGIGAAAGRMMAAEGASVVLADIVGERAVAVAEEIASIGHAARGITADVGDPDDVKAMIDAAVDGFGGIDVLFNNAAAINLLSRDVQIVELELDVWNQTFQTNVTGPLLGAKYAIPHMIARGGGSIINTASAAGLRANDGLTSYGVTKAALIGLSRHIAVQYGKAGIRSNVIAPGVTHTAAMPMDDEKAAMLLSFHMTPRLGEADDIAAAAVFLASDEAAFVTAAVLCVDGGLTSYLPFVPARRAM